MPRRDALFSTVRSEGGLLPTELLARIAQGDSSIPGVNPSDYHLLPGETLGSRITDAWNRLRTAWKEFATRLAALPDDDAGTTLTRERWLLVLFDALGYGRLQVQRALMVGEKEYPISHGWGAVPIHLVSAKRPIDRRTAGARGAANASPHSLVQELLNRSDAHLWAFVSNGRVLRLLRDNAALSRHAYIEFDLEAMFSDEVYEDFVVLWRTCHQSRFEGERPEACWLEQWTRVAAETGTRARDDLRGGVESAIAALGTGFVSHPANSALKARLRSGELSSQELYRQLLRVIYRLLFVFVAEDRDLLHPPGVPREATQRYARFYSVARIRALANKRRGGPHPDLWAALTVVFRGLGTPTGIPALALPGLGSFLWSRDACPDLDDAQLANQYLLAAVRHIAFVQDRTARVLRPIDYRNLGTEELGAVYESLLEQHPEVNPDAGTFALNTAAGNERKTTGSYYTPTSLITELLDSAVDPVLAEAAARPDPENAILALKVIDPACGSGHFLIAAAHRIAKRLAAVRTGDDEPAPEALRTALRDVISRCIHGIDLNPMAVELCKVSLWMESMEPGKPLGFLDHRIVRGNGLLGATPALLDAGVPDDAFVALTGDDKGITASLKRRNKASREGGVIDLFSGGAPTSVDRFADQLQALDAMADTDLSAVQAKAQRWSALVSSPAYQHAVHAADTWCAAFVAPKAADTVQITHDEFLAAKQQPETVHANVRAAVAQLVHQYAFLHWHLAFPDVFARGGFDLVLGNPPWEKVQFSEKEFFAVRAPEIAELPGAARKRAIENLRVDNAALYAEYEQARRHSDAESLFIRSSGRFPLCGTGKVNTYAIFAEVMRDAIGPTGRGGIIVPTGIATDDTTKLFFADLMTRGQLASLFDFENRDKLFPGVDSRMKFCLLTMSGAERSEREAAFVFFAHQPNDLRDTERRFTLSPDDLALINPNTRTAPVFRSQRDAEITKGIYRRVPVLVREGDPDGNPWGVEFQQGLFNMTSDSHLFRTADELRAAGATLTGNVWVRGAERWLPLYEAKMTHHFNHRFGDYAMRAADNEGSSLPDVPLEQLQDPTYVVQPRYWVAEEHVHSAMRDTEATWFIGYRGIGRSTDERTLISASYPYAGIGDSAKLLIPIGKRKITLLAATLASFVCDYAARSSVGGSNLNWFLIKQFPVIAPKAITNSRDSESTRSASLVSQAALELTYTAWDLAGFASDMGYHGPPFRWDPARRELLRAELDAVFFHLYGIPRDDVDYIMDTFPIVCRKDVAAFGEYRTKRLILERYDALAEAAATGAEYQTILDPPPADPRCAHPASTRPDWATL